MYQLTRVSSGLIFILPGFMGLLDLRGYLAARSYVASGFITWLETCVHRESGFWQ